MRNDAYMRQHGAPVEQAKPTAERGKYLHPELFGAPQARAIHARPADKTTGRSRPAVPDEQADVGTGDR